jgi:alpha-glucosidase
LNKEYYHCRYYGFGEKSGDANKAGRRLRMCTADALGYDAGTTDPLYKHIPFYLTVRPDLSGRTIGLFYDNLSHATFDLGLEIDAYHGPFRCFEASDGDLDLYVIFGPMVRNADNGPAARRCGRQSKAALPFRTADSSS